MKLNPSSSVRTSLYIMSVFVNACLAVLTSSGVVIPIMVLAVIGGFNAVVAFVAGVNVTPDEF